MKAVVVLVVIIYSFPVTMAAQRLCVMDVLTLNEALNGAQWTGAFDRLTKVLFDNTKSGKGKLTSDGA